jgi:HEAT repeat protein
MSSTRFFIIFTVFFLATFFLGIARAENQDLLLARLQHYDPSLQMENLKETSKVKDRQLVRALGTVATDQNEDWHIRIAAIRELGAAHDPAATDALMADLLDFCPAIRWNAANALGNYDDDPRVVDSLIAALHSDTLYIREAAIRSLGRIGSRKAVPHLIRQLDSPSFALRLGAITALGEIGDVAAVPSLKRMAERESDALLKSKAAVAIGEIEGRKKG